MIYITDTNKKKSNQKKTRYLTPTAINTYLRCPRRFYLSKIKKVKQLPNIHLLRGVCVHSAIDQFYANGFHRCSQMLYSETRKAALSLLSREWHAKKSVFSFLGLSSADLEFYLHESKNMMINFLHHLISKDGMTDFDPITEKTMFSKHLKLRGRPDLIHPQKKPPLIIEFKTSKSPQITDEYKRQIILYAILYEETYGRFPDTAIHFLRFQNGFKHCPIDTQTIEDTKQLVYDIHKQTQSDNIDDYPCLCGYCNQSF